jgi:hypothetical protein
LPKDGNLEIPMPALSAPAARVEVRVVLPGGRSYALAEPSRAAPLPAPPGVESRRSLSAVSQQVSQQLNAGRKGASAGPSQLFPTPLGFAEIGAAWSALSANPSPLAIRVEAEKERPQWF